MIYRTINSPMTNYKMNNKNNKNKTFNIVFQKFLLSVCSSNTNKIKPNWMTFL